MLILDETPYEEPKDVLQVAPTGVMKASAMAVAKLPVDVAAAGLLVAGGLDELLFNRDNFFKLYDEEVKPIQDKLTPEPGSVSAAGRFISGIVGFAPALLAGPAGIPVLAAEGAINTGANLVEQGVKPEVATEAGILTGATTVAMAGLPAGAKTWGKTLALASLNPVIGAASTEAEKKLLESQGYGKIAEQYDPFDPVGRGIDTTLGIAFGAMGKYAEARREMLTRTKDSIDTIANWQRMFKDTPFDTTDPKTADLGYKAMQKALGDIAEGRNVDLSGIVPDVVKVKTPDAPVRQEEAQAKAAISEALKTAEVTSPDFVEHRGQTPDDVVLREALNAVPREQIHEMLLTDPVSGARTRTAFEILQKAQPAELIGISDARGLGAIDKHLGHQAGDDFTRKIVEAHQAEGVPIYRASDKGDEFITRWNGVTKEEAYAKLEAVNNRLRQSVLEVKNPDGSKRYFTNLEMYVGLGGGKDGYNEAGHAVGEQKRTNQPAGYVKGEFPRHLVELSQERGLAAAGGDREAAPGPAAAAQEPGKVNPAAPASSEPPYIPEGVKPSAASAPPRETALATPKAQDTIINDPAARRVEARLAQSGDFPIHTGTDALGAPTSVPVSEFLAKAKEEFKKIESTRDIYDRISDCL